MADAGPLVECLRDRLIEAADVELTESGTLTGRIEAVAHRAGVSRATAYRQVGSVSELLTQVGLRRAWRYLTGLRDAVDAEAGAIAKLEAAMIYGARVLPLDSIVADLIARQFTAGRDPEVYEMMNRMIRPTVEAGQRSGELRSDIGVDRIIDYLTEQSYFATFAEDTSAQTVSRRFRTFMEPVISPSAGACNHPPFGPRR
jgi:AcrR family transcriptional regulator